MPLRNRLLLMITGSLSVIIFSKMVYVENDIIPYYNEYMSLYKQHCSVNKLDGTNNRITMFTDKFDDEILGLCYQQFNSQFVFLNKNRFYGMTESSKKSLVFHELNHCVLGLLHSDNPNSLMYAYQNELKEEQIKVEQVDIFNKTCNNN